MEQELLEIKMALESSKSDQTRLQGQLNLEQLQKSQDVEHTNKKQTDLKTKLAELKTTNNKMRVELKG